MNWSQYPFVRILIPFIAGLLTAIHGGLEQQWIDIALISLVAGYSILILFFFRWVSYRNRWISGLFINVILFLFGYQFTSINPAFAPDPLSFSGKPQLLIFKLDEDPEEKVKSFKLMVRLLALKSDSSWCPTNIKMLLYIQKSETVKKLGYGDLLMANAVCSETKNPGNPGEFDYKKVLENRGIRYQSWVDKDNWVTLDSTAGNELIAKSKWARRKLLGILQANGIKGKELAVASAVLLGYDEYLEPEQKKHFSGAGAMHILCVSGLHVGIIAMVLNFLLKFLNYKRLLQILKLFLLLGLIWMYAAITGFSPSVLRASTMFSFVVTGLTFKRNVSIYNMLAASAFLLLLIDPYIIMRVGFQLSYLALFGIVLLYKPISTLFIFNQKLWNKLWQLTSVSLAATLATFPLSIYYFNQFPNLFLLSNVFVIPLSFLIVYFGIFLFVFSIIPSISFFFGQGLMLIIKGLNYIVALLEGLPYSTSQNLYLTLPELLLIYGVLCFLAAFLFFKRFGPLFLSITFSVLLMISFSLNKYKHLNQNEVIVYNIGGYSAVEFIHGRQSLFLCDSALLLMPLKISYASKGSHLRRGIIETRFYDMGKTEIVLPWIQKHGPFIRVSNRTIYLLSENIDPTIAQNLPPLDIVILSGRSGVNPQDFMKGFPVRGRLILDSSLPLWEIKKWDTTFFADQDKIFDVSVSGAYTEGID